MRIPVPLGHGGAHPLQSAIWASLIRHRMFLASRKDVRSVTSYATMKASAHSRGFSKMHLLPTLCQDLGWGGGTVAMQLNKVNCIPAVTPSRMTQKTGDGLLHSHLRLHTSMNTLLHYIHTGPYLFLHNLICAVHIVSYLWFCTICLCLWHWYTGRFPLGIN